MLQKFPSNQDPLGLAGIAFKEGQDTESVEFEQREGLSEYGHLSLLYSNPYVIQRERMRFFPLLLCKWLLIFIMILCNADFLYYLCNVSRRGKSYVWNVCLADTILGDGLRVCLIIL
jgi:hypothetical protein